MTLLVIVVVWVSNFRRPIRRSVCMAAAVALVIGLAVLGSVRVRETPSVRTIGYYASAESVLTAWSRDLYLTSPRPVLAPAAVPKYLASDLVNVVPRALLPAKDSFRLVPEDEGYTVSSALGGISAVASLLLNFGFAGSLVALAALSLGLRRLQARCLATPSSVASVAYCVLTGGLATSFFRDPFSISIVRWGIVSAVLTVGLFHVASGVAALSGARSQGRGLAARLSTLPRP